jgi:hypothetical protein
MVVLNKDEAKTIMKQKDFENFFSKTSRIIERALNSDYDVMGAFFEDVDEDESK